MNKAYLLLGSNLEDPKEQLGRAILQIEQKLGAIVKRSSLYKTAAWGNTDQPDFINMIVVCETALSARKAMQTLLEIEQGMGRHRSTRFAPRIIDIDILYFNREILAEPELTLPHPAIPDRRFTLVPLNELDASFIHPISGKTSAEMLKDCKDELTVEKLSESAS
jgi:2-amino-4-hydroxy-6-hydroxymethyldihydropteridine diphosphokinase